MRISEIISNIREIAEKEKDSCQLKREFGLTQGQVLHIDAFTKRPTMVPCWMKIYIKRETSLDPYTLYLAPMLAISAKHYAHSDRNALTNTIPDQAFLDHLIDIDIAGGETLITTKENAIFPYGTSSERGIRQLESDPTIEVTPEHKVAIYNDGGELILQNSKNFFAPKPGRNSFVSGKTIHTYSEHPIWLPCITDEESEKIFFAADDTCTTATLIPTMALTGKNTYKYFLDFAGEWQSQNDSISIKIGPFTVSHYFEGDEWYSEITI